MQSLGEEASQAEETVPAKEVLTLKMSLVCSRHSYEARVARARRKVVENDLGERAGDPSDKGPDSRLYSKCSGKPLAAFMNGTIWFGAARLPWM